jgi:hypothetical protein
VSKVFIYTSWIQIISFLKLCRYLHHLILHFLQLIVENILQQHQVNKFVTHLSRCLDGRDVWQPRRRSYRILYFVKSRRTTLGNILRFLKAYLLVVLRILDHLIDQ